MITTLVILWLVIFAMAIWLECKKPEDESRFDDEDYWRGI